MEREDGYYWLRKIDPEPHQDGEPFIAQWQGGTWNFIGSLYMLDDDELRLENYEVGRAVADQAPVPDEFPIGVTEKGAATSD